MSLAEPTFRPFEPGTTGWTAADLEDPRIAAQWNDGHYEIIEGVLTKMPPAYFNHGAAPLALIGILNDFFKARNIPVRFSFDVDIVLAEDRVVRPDVVMMTGEDRRVHVAAAQAQGRPDPSTTRLSTPPTLVIESLSPDHHRHDTHLKRRIYAEFGIPNYWLLDAYARSLQCLVLRGAQYELDASGSDADDVRPSSFPDLAIPLARVWSVDE